MRDESASIYIHFNGSEEEARKILMDIRGSKQEELDESIYSDVDLTLSFSDLIRISEALDYLAAELRKQHFPAGDLDELQERIEKALEFMEAEAESE